MKKNWSQYYCEWSVWDDEAMQCGWLWYRSSSLVRWDLMHMMLLHGEQHDGYYRWSSSLRVAWGKLRWFNIGKQAVPNYLCERMCRRSFSQPSSRERTYFNIQDGRTMKGRDRRTSNLPRRFHFWCRCRWQCGWRRRWQCCCFLASALLFWTSGTPLQLRNQYLRN